MKKEKGATAAPNPETQCKDTNTSLKYKILHKLKDERLTAIELNRYFHFNDARKVISELRAIGYRIADYRLPNRCKVYFLKESPQLELFAKGGES